MLFNSFAFLFAFLPIVLAGYFLLDRWAPAGGARAAASCAAITDCP